MKTALILTHAFLTGNKRFNRRKEAIINISLSYFRHFNPDSYIIVVGHGGYTPPKVIECSDWYYWQDNLINGDIQWGHPSCTNIALQHCIEENIDFVVKTRLDSIHFMFNLISYCQNLVAKSQKEFLVSHASLSKFEIMDLFMAGNTQTISKLYKLDTWMRCWPDIEKSGGTKPVAINFMEEICKNKIEAFDKKNWIDELNNRIYISPPSDTMWLDLRKFEDCVLDNPDLLNSTSNILKLMLWRH